MSSIPRLPAGVAPQMKVQARTSRLPDGRQVEPIAHPLYSAVYVPATVAIPNDLVFFGYGQGDPIPGLSSVIAKPWHTNMDRGGMLAEPRHHLITGVRFFVHPMAFDTSGVPSLADFMMSATTSNDNDSFEDVLHLTQSTTLVVEHQGKVIVEEPAFLVPGNLGADGVASNSMDNGTAATSTSLDITIVGGRGLPRTFGRYGLLLRPGEAIEVSLQSRWAHQATQRLFTNDGKFVFAILDGTSVRAVR